MFGRFRFQRFVDNLEALASITAAAGAVVGSVYAPVALLNQHTFSDGLVGVAEAAVAIPFATATGGGVGAIAGACFGGTLPVTMPVVAYHYASKHYEQKKAEMIKIYPWR